MKKPEIVELWSLPTKMGVSMPKDHYQRVAEFISSTLECQTNKRIKLNDLLDKARKDLDKEFRGNVSWYLLHVKGDMAARGLISISFVQQLQQIIAQAPSKNRRPGQVVKRRTADAF